MRTDARPYALGVLAFIGATLCLVRWVDERRTRFLVGYVVLAAFVVYVHVILVPPLLAHAAYLWMRRADVPARVVAFGAAAFALLLVPLVPIVLETLGNRDALDLGTPGPGAVLFAVLPPEILAAVAAGLAVVAYLVREATDAPAPGRAELAMLVVWAMAAPIALYVVSVAIGAGVLGPQHITQSAPAIALLAAYLIRRLDPAQARRIVVVVMAIVSVIFGATSRQYTDDWRGAMSYASALASDRSTPVLVRSGLVQATQVDWLTDPDRVPVTIAPAEVYLAAGTPVALPFGVTASERDYLAQGPADRGVRLPSSPSSPGPSRTRCSPGSREGCSRTASRSSSSGASGRSSSPSSSERRLRPNRSGSRSPTMDHAGAETPRALSPAALGRISLSQVWAAVAVLVPVLVVSSTPLIAIDLTYQVRAGELMLTGGHLLRTDPFTATAAGVAWTNQQWLGQILLALTFRAGGWLGFALLRGGLAAGILTLVFAPSGPRGIPQDRGPAHAGRRRGPARGIPAPPPDLRDGLLRPGGVAPGPTGRAPSRPAAHPAGHDRVGQRPRQLLPGPDPPGDRVGRRAEPRRIPGSHHRRPRPDHDARDVRSTRSGRGCDVCRPPVHRPGDPQGRRGVGTALPTVRSYAGVVFFASVIGTAYLLSRVARSVPAATYLTLAVFFLAALMAIRGIYWWAVAAPVALAPLLASASRRQGRDPVNAGNAALIGFLFVALVVALAPWLSHADRDDPGEQLLAFAPARLTEELEHVLEPGDVIYNAQEWGSWLEFRFPDNPVHRPTPASRSCRTSSGTGTRSSPPRSRDGAASWICGRWDVAVLALDQQPELISKIRNDPAWRLVYEDEQGVILVRR